MKIKKESPEDLVSGIGYPHERDPNGKWMVMDRPYRDVPNASIKRLVWCARLMQDAKIDDDDICLLLSDMYWDCFEECRLNKTFAQPQHTDEKLRYQYLGMPSMGNVSAEKLVSGLALPHTKDPNGKWMVTFHGPAFSRRRLVFYAQKLLAHKLVSTDVCRIFEWLYWDSFAECFLNKTFLYLEQQHKQQYPASFAPVSSGQIQGSKQDRLNGTNG